MQQEHLANLGYFAFVKEAQPGVPAAIPNTYLPLYSESLTTSSNFDDQTPIYGGKFATFATLRGIRDHGGDLSVIAEANSTAQLFDALLTKTATNPSGQQYQSTYQLAVTNPKTLTVDVSVGSMVKRFFGLSFSEITPEWKDNEMRHKLKASALGSFQARTIKTVATTTLTLDQKYDQRPTKGLVIGDYVRIVKASDGTSLDTTIATVNADGVTVTLADSAAAFGVGDIIHLRPVTAPTFNIVDNFLWAKTKFCFGADATTALAATDTPVEPGSNFTITHSFKDANGEKRSGSFDPASLVRTTGNMKIAIKQFFDKTNTVQAWNDMTKSALVIRHFAGDSNQYEYRITVNSLVTDGPTPNLTSGEINYSTMNFKPNNDATTGLAYKVDIIHAIPTI